MQGIFRGTACDLHSFYFWSRSQKKFYISLLCLLRWTQAINSQSENLKTFVLRNASKTFQPQEWLWRAETRESDGAPLNKTWVQHIDIHLSRGDILVQPGFFVPFTFHFTRCNYYKFVGKIYCQNVRESFTSFKGWTILRFSHELTCFGSG